MKKSIVALVRCATYNEEDVCAAVRRGAALLGGIDTIVSKGQKILLKPNMLNGTHPDHCVITHPSVFAAAATLVRDAGCTVSWGDSPAIEKCSAAGINAGFDAVAQRMGICAADFDNGKKVTHPGAKIAGSFTVANGVLEADGLISLPKLKTHGLTRLTGAVKNQFGCIPGLLKAQQHARLPLPNDFAAFVVDINTFIRPRLVIMDAIMAMEGNGPNAGTPRFLGVIIMSTDPVAADAVACRLIALDPTCVPTCTAGEAAGLGVYQDDLITLVGDPLEPLVSRDFNVVRKPAFAIYGTGLKRFIKNRLTPRPVIRSRDCIRCGKCVAICPVEPKALAWSAAGKTQPPRYAYSRCIRCFCCQETCPAKAISIATTLDGRIAPVFAAGIIMFMSRARAAARRITPPRKK